ncbi:MAG: endopeptidase La [Acidobacteriaceae bacterium]|nr:endopeptidase La [Acidobacteriaceae bacterium]MBV9780851.1 endopeptidase La [Acidobacteriaceae bacterium]
MNTIGEHEFQVLPALPLKNTILFPGLLLPLSVGRESSITAVQASLKTEGKEVILIAQRDSQIESPQQDDLYTIGTRAVIRKSSRQGDGMMEILVFGIERVVLVKLEQTEPYLNAKFRVLPLPDDGGSEVEALSRALFELSAKAIALAQPQSAAELTRMLAGSDDPLRLAYLLASIFSLDLAREQKLLEAETRADALRLMHSYLTHELQVLELRQKIASTARDEMSKEQREYLLRQQLRAIQQELGEKDGEKADLDLLRERFEKANLPEEPKKEFEREMARLERLPSGAPDYHVTRSYLEFVLDLPWNAQTEDNLEISHARQVLDEDHFGLKEVKERILEHLSVLKRNPEAKAPILCFVGPPGVGKTSLGQSIARALGRKFERFSLGGMHDEAELRGHRRTYIGAMAGRLLQAMRRAGAKNPVLLLDEVDKLGRDFRGDPAAALLEVLDPEQNKSFRDNYLDLAFDLSKVLFITTANSLDTIPQPLLDRMEMLRLSGYSTEEKLQIARRYLIPRQLKMAGLTEEELEFTDAGLNAIISGYTREAGLRRLERSIARVARKITLRFAEGQAEKVAITPEILGDLLGPEMFLPEEMRKAMPAGVATGLAWTETGGDVLYIESSLLPSGKDLTITGQLGEVMQESAKIAKSYIWAHAEDLGIDPEVIKNNGVHVHVPAGAIPKDGPSAGITMTTAMTSLFTGLPARSDTAMTGEVTLAGLVLPIGGVKEKVLAARRAGITRVILPKGNKKDLRELPDHVRQEMQFHFVDRVEEVLSLVIPNVKLRPLALAS